MGVHGLLRGELREGALRLRSRHSEGRESHVSSWTSGSSSSSRAQWINEGTFFGTPAEIDPFAGPNDGTDRFTIPQQPIRRRLTELPQFVVNRGGEYCFMPGLRALRWLADLDT